MGQHATLQALDARIHDAFCAAGLSDAGTYTAPGGSAVPCRVYFDSDVQQMGDYSRALGQKDIVTLLLIDVAAPAEGGLIVFDGVTAALEAMESGDKSKQRWIVSYL